MSRIGGKTWLWSLRNTYTIKRLGQRQIFVASFEHWLTLAYLGRATRRSNSALSNEGQEFSQFIAIVSALQSPSAYACMFSKVKADYLD